MKVAKHCKYHKVGSAMDKYCEKYVCIMQKNKQTSTKLLVIVITTSAIIAMATTTSLSAATPVFAKENCNEDGSICSGGSSFKVGSGLDLPGGHGGRLIRDESGSPQFNAGGFGQGLETISGLVGGGGGHGTCDASGCTSVGGFGLHTKGPGGNSDR
jgi:hypothetical protein